MDAGILAGKQLCAISRDKMLACVINIPSPIEISVAFQEFESERAAPAAKA
jgi:hypothetical protein